MDHKTNDESIHIVISCIRVIATILVVLGHCVFYTINTTIPQMGIDYTTKLVDSSIFHRAAMIIGGLIYTCHMQLFMTLSGMLYSYGLEKGKYQKTKQFLAKKGRRLLPPYLLVSILYNVPILLWAGYFGTGVFPAKNICLYLIGFGKNHLWFLVTLFIIFAIVRLIRIKSFDSSFGKAILLVSALLFVFTDSGLITITEFLYIDRVFLYLFWFLFGMLVHSILQSDMRGINYCNASTLLTLFIGIIWCNNYVIYRMLGHYCFLLLSRFCGVLFFVFSAICYSQKRCSLNKTFQIIDKWSLDIYLYGVPVNYIILMIVMTFLQAPISLFNIASAILAFLRIALQIIIPIIISICIDKIRKKILNNRLKSQ